MSDELESVAFDGYGRGPRELIRDDSLSASARLLWIILEDMSSPHSPRPFPGQKRLAKHVGCSPRHVRRLLDELVTAEWLVVARRGVTKTNVYRLARPSAK